LAIKGVLFAKRGFRQGKCCFFAEFTERTLRAQKGNTMNRKPMAKQDYSGLTVNERLCVSGLLERFDAAARRRNRERMIAMLKRVALPEKYAAQWVDTLLGDQNFFYW
jgi:hypothetical protein